MGKKEFSLSPIIPGAGLSIALAVAALGLSELNPAFNPAIISLLLGMFTANFIEKKDHVFGPGARFCYRFVLPAAVGLSGSQLVFTGGAALLWPYSAGCGLLVFGITFLVARGFGLEDDLSVLLSTGLSTLGPGAVAMTSDASGSDSQDTSAAVIAVITIGMAGMLVMGFYPQGLGLGTEKLAFLIGVTLPDLTLVKAAGLPEGALRLAGSFVLLKSVLLGAVLLRVFFSRRRTPRSGARFPWFMVLFIILALAVGLLPEGHRISAFVSPAGRFAAAAGLAATGLCVDFDSAPAKGLMPFAAAVFSWGISIFFIYLVVKTL